MSGVEAPIISSCDIPPPDLRRRKLKYDKLLSSLAFNFSLRRYALAALPVYWVCFVWVPWRAGVEMAGQGGDGGGGGGRTLRTPAGGCVVPR